MILTQFFYTLTFLATLVSAVGVLIFFLCCTPDEERFIPLTFGLGCALVSAGKEFCVFFTIQKVYYFWYLTEDLISRNFCCPGNFDIRILG